MLQYLKELTPIFRKANAKLGKIFEMAKNTSLKDVNVKNVCPNTHTKTTETLLERVSADYAIFKFALERILS